MRIGIDWGGTKIEIAALDDCGNFLLRERTPTPKDDYPACIKAVQGLVRSVERQLDQTGTVGVGIPGSVSPSTGLVKNANSTWMNGQPLLDDLQVALDREVRIQNDANCFAVSEAVDGAAAGKHMVVGVIIGTGTGSGIAIDGKAVFGKQGIAGEFGHVPLAPMTADEFPGPQCWCGRRGCMETFTSGTGFLRDYHGRGGDPTVTKVSELLESGGEIVEASYKAYVSRLGRGLALLINILDPDVIVLGGGMSNIESLYTDVIKPAREHVFSDGFETEIVKAKYGDSSGVRGAAWLWN